MLRTLKVLLTGALALSLLVAPHMVPTPAAAATAPYPAQLQDARDRLLTATNAERIKAGLPPLILMPEIEPIAQDCSKRQAEINTMEHCPGFSKSFPPGWLYGGENVARGYTLGTVTKAWMDSPSHRANILSDRFTHIGIGYYFGDNSQPFYTQNFAQYPPVTQSSKPMVNGTAKVGSTLRVNRGAWAGAKSLTDQWFADGEAITEEGVSTLVLAPEHADKRITVKTSGYAFGYEPVFQVSEPTPLVARADLPNITPLLSGTPLTGSTLTVNPGAWPTGSTLTYSWSLDGAVQPNSNAPTLFLDAAALGKIASVELTVEKPGFNTVKRYLRSTTIGLQPLQNTAPTIQGEATVDSTLTALPGAWTQGAALSYQWFADQKPLPGATTAALKLTPELLGKLLHVELTGSKLHHETITRTSGALRVGLPKLTPGTVKIVGSSTVGSMLTAETGAWPAGTQFAYRWFINGNPIDVSGSTLKLSEAHAGKKVAVEVTATKVNHEAAKVVSSEISIPLLKLIPGTLAVSGTPSVGSTLTVSKIGWPADAKLSYQWHANGAAIAGATSDRLAVTSAHLGKAISLTLTASKAGATSVTKTSAAKTIAAGKLTVGAPKLSTQSPTPGKLVYANGGSWSSGTVLSYQWHLGSTVIKGATSSKITVKPEYGGQALRVTVTGKKAGYTTEVRSISTNKVPYSKLSAPTPKLSAPVLGKPLKVTAGTWTSGTKLTYRWFVNGKVVSGATGSTLTLNSSHVGKVVKVEVKGTKAGYTTVAKYAQTKKVAKGSLSMSTPKVVQTAKVYSTVKVSVPTRTAGATMAYQWYADSKALNGATKSSYKIPKSLKGKKITVKVTLKKAGYNSLTKSAPSVLVR